MAKVQKNLRNPDRPPTHPGAVLREIVLPGLDASKSDFAAALGVSRQTLHGILSEKNPVTVEMALRLGHVLGNGPQVWLAMQQAHDLWHGERRLDTSGLRRLNDAA